MIVNRHRAVADAWLEHFRQQRRDRAISEGRKHAEPDQYRDDPGHVRHGRNLAREIEAIIRKPALQLVAPNLAVVEPCSRNGDQIGRASGGARVCQYVKITVVAVELKKQMRKIQRTELKNPL